MTSRFSRVGGQGFCGNSTKASVLKKAWRLEEGSPKLFKNAWRHLWTTLYYYHQIQIDFVIKICAINCSKERNWIVNLGNPRHLQKGMFLLEYQYPGLPFWFKKNCFLIKCSHHLAIFGLFRTFIKLQKSEKTVKNVMRL
jgi:hypothetical protein